MFCLVTYLSTFTLFPVMCLVALPRCSVFVDMWRLRCLSRCRHYFYPGYFTYCTGICLLSCFCRCCLFGYFSCIPSMLCLVTYLSTFTLFPVMCLVTLPGLTVIVYMYYFNSYAHDHALIGRIISFHTRPVIILDIIWLEKNFIFTLILRNRSCDRMPTICAIL